MCRYSLYRNLMDNSIEHHLPLRCCGCALDYSDLWYKINSQFMKANMPIEEFTVTNSPSAAEEAMFQRGRRVNLDLKGTLPSAH